MLIGLFLMQSLGTASVGCLFGPVMLVWFTVLALLGIWGIAQQPRILQAVDPRYGVAVLLNGSWRGFIMLGAVFLAVTGTEALYADMGHFGRTALRTAWLRLVFPALLLNYFGQGAVLLGNPLALENPFYRLAPEWALFPLVVLAARPSSFASLPTASSSSAAKSRSECGAVPLVGVNFLSSLRGGCVSDVEFLSRSQ